MNPMPAERDPAPDFTLDNEDGEPVHLSDYRGRKVVLYFYPKDDTPGCTTQACDLRDNAESFEQRDAVILGVSPDPVTKHRKFKDKYDLPFTLLADVDHEVAEKYGVWKEKSFMGRKYMGNERTTFLIGEDGRIVKVLPNVKPAEHTSRLLDLL
jgi:thioredoxin-dependent peroxiredoxin